MRDAEEMARLAEQLGRRFEARVFLTLAVAKSPSAKTCAVSSAVWPRFVILQSPGEGKRSPTCLVPNSRVTDGVLKRPTEARFARPTIKMGISRLNFWSAFL